MTIIRAEEQFQLYVILLGVLRLGEIAVYLYGLRKPPKALVATAAEDDAGRRRDALGQLLLEQAQGAYSLLLQILPGARVDVDMEPIDRLYVLAICLLGQVVHGRVYVEIYIAFAVIRIEPFAQGLGALRVEGARGDGLAVRLDRGQHPRSPRRPTLKELYGLVVVGLNFGHTFLSYRPNSVGQSLCKIVDAT